MSQYAPWNILLIVLDLGHSRTGALSVFGRGFLPWCGLLRAGVRCDRAKHLQNPGQLEGWVPHSGQPTRPRELPFCSAWQQDRFGEQTGLYPFCGVWVPYKMLTKHLSGIKSQLQTLKSIVFLTGDYKASTGVVSEQKWYSILWNQCKRGH